MKKNLLYQFSLLCLILNNFSSLQSNSSVTYYDGHTNTTKTAHYETLKVDFNPHITATLRLDSKPIQVHVEPAQKPIPVQVNIDEKQIDSLITKIFQQLPESLEDSAADLKESFQILVGSFINLENAIRYGYPIAFWALLSLSGIYGSRVLWKVIEKKVINPKPAILLPGSKCGYWDRVRRQRAGYISPTMIFDQEVKDRLIEIQEKTKNIRKHIHEGKTATYDNLLLHGLPGTGKTLFAQILADYTDMDFLPVTAASLLQSGVEGIKYFNELLDIANKSKYGVIIFVDEADALFIDRDTLDPASDHYKVLNHILALTGNGSSKFMLIAATNHAYVMDEAMGRRFQDRVLMPLPHDATRKELIELYANIVLYDSKNNSSDFIATAQSLLTPQKISFIVQQTAGLSHAEIKDMIFAMHKKALATKTGLIAEIQVNNAINEAIKKSFALKEDKKLRARR